MSGDLNMDGNTITELFQMPPTPFQPPQNPADTNMPKYIEDLRKNTTYDNYATAFLIMKNFLAMQLLSECGIRKSLPSQPLLLDGSKSMTGSLRMGNKKISNLTNPTNNTDAANKAYIETGFLKLPDGTMTGVLNLPQNPNISIIQALN